MALEDPPYVDPDTVPGDAGTEAWADKESGSKDPLGRGPLAEPAGATDADDDGVIDGSPADTFIHDADAVGARDDSDSEV